jgi:hypothetical protein
VEGLFYNYIHTVHIYLLGRPYKGFIDLAACILSYTYIHMCGERGNVVGLGGRGEWFACGL